MRVKTGLLFVCAMAISTVAGAEETKDAKTTKPAAGDKGGGGGAPDQAAMMAAMAKYTTPGEQHKKLAAWAGNWKSESKAWMEPGKPPMESKGSMTTKVILGGRFTEDSFKGNFMGKPFEGHGINGYDLAHNKYVSLWIDSMSTWFMTMEGQFDADGKVLTMTGTAFDPASGKDSPFKMVTRIESDKKHVMEMWGAGPDGKDMKMMEITYTKK